MSDARRSPFFDHHSLIVLGLLMTNAGAFDNRLVRPIHRVVQTERLEQQFSSGHVKRFSRGDLDHATQQAESRIAVLRD